MANMLKILVITLLVQHSQALSLSSALYREVFTYHNETYYKAEYALQVVDKIYSAFRQWFFTIIFCEFTYFENRILKYTETKDDGYPVLLLSSCPNSTKSRVQPRIDKHGKTAYIVTSNELSLEINERVIAALLRTGVFKPRSPVIFVITLPVSVDSYFYYAMKRHFELLWSRKVSNSVLIVWSDHLKMYAYNPFFGAVNQITNITDVGRYLSHQYFNLYGHQLRLSVFRKLYLSDQKGPVKCDDSLLAKTVIKRLNASCLPLAPRDGSTVGDILDNVTATGVTRDLLDGFTDLELNSRILKNSYYGYIDTTYPLFQDEMCFLLKKADRQSSFSTTIKLISVKMLIIFIFIFHLLIAIGIVIQKLEAKVLGVRPKRAASTTISLVKCFLRQTEDIKFLGPAFRTLSMIIMLYSLIINSVIDSIIISSITYPRYKSDINTMKDLIHTNLTLGVHTRHLKLFWDSVPNDHYEKMQHRVQVINDKKINEIITKRLFQYAVLLRKTDATYISRKSENMKNGRPLFHTVQQCPISCFIVYGLNYGSPYLPRLDSLLWYLNQGGILGYWSKTEEASTSNLAKILNTAENNKERKSLSTENVEEVFYVWLTGLAVSTIVLILEIYYNRFIQRLWIF